MRRGSPRRLEARSLALGAVLLAVIVPSTLALLLGGPLELARALAGVDPARIAAALALILAAEAVRAVRLQVIMSAAGYRLPFHASLAARLIGRLVGLLTPGSVGSTPARAAVVGAYSGAPIGASLGGVVLETLSDSLVAALAAMAASLPSLPSSLPVLLASLFTIALWSAGTAAAVSERIAYEAYARLGLPEGLRCRLEAQRRMLVEALGEVRDPAFSARLAALTVAGFALEAYSVLAASGALDPSLLPVGVAAVSAAYVASVFPTPGGGGLVEVSLGVFLDPQTLLAWRLAQLAAGLLPGVAVLAVIPALREYVREGALGGGGCPQLEDIRHARPPIRVQR